MKTIIILITCLLAIGCATPDCKCPTQDTYIYCPGEGVILLDPGTFAGDEFLELQEMYKELFEYLDDMETMERRQGT